MGDKASHILLLLLSLYLHVPLRSVLKIDRNRMLMFYFHDIDDKLTDKQRREQGKNAQEINCLQLINMGRGERERERKRRTLHHWTTCLTRWTNIMFTGDEKKRNISSAVVLSWTYLSHIRKCFIIIVSLVLRFATEWWINKTTDNRRPSNFVPSNASTDQKEVFVGVNPLCYLNNRCLT